MKSQRIPVGTWPTGRIGALLLSAVAGAILALVTGVGPVQAHDSLVTTNPIGGSVVHAVPKLVSLTFAENVLTLGTAIRVQGPAGVVSVGAVQIKGTTISQVLDPAAGDGGYTVLWRATSADGHPVSGSFAFTVTGSGHVGAPASGAATQISSGATGAPTSTDTPGPAAGGWGRGPAMAGVVIGVIMLGAVGAALVARRRRGPAS